jgi:hypothetical protein
VACSDRQVVSGERFKPLVANFYRLLFHDGILPSHEALKLAEQDWRIENGQWASGIISTPPVHPSAQLGLETVALADN